jgi:hypothetical protein
VAIHNIQELREAAPPELKHLSDQELVNDYAARANLDPSYVAQRLGYTPEATSDAYAVAETKDNGYLSVLVAESDLGGVALAALGAVLLAAVVGFFLALRTSGKFASKESAVRTGRTWAAYMLVPVSLASIHGFVKKGFVEGLVSFAVTLVVFPAIAFFVGWVFRTIRPVQVSNSPPSEIPAPGVERASGSQAERPTEQDFSAGGLGTQLPDPVDEERIYAAIAHEIETATFEKGLWTRLFAECDGDESKTKARYIKERAVRLIEAERKAQTM